MMYRVKVTIPTGDPETPEEILYVGSNTGGQKFGAEGALHVRTFVFTFGLLEEVTRAFRFETMAAALAPAELIAQHFHASCEVRVEEVSPPQAVSAPPTASAQCEPTVEDEITGAPA
jgi:hypothetical protein